jgi:hypothetical protein
VPTKKLRIVSLTALGLASTVKRPEKSKGESIRSKYFYRRLSLLSLFSAILAFLIIDGAYFGVPRFYEHSLLNHFSLPVLSCRYLEGNTIDCYMYRLQGFLEVGWPEFYSNLMVMTLVYFILALAFGRYWCGWVCPFGLVQRLISGLRERLGIRPRRVPEKHQPKVNKIKYVIMFIILLLSLSIGIPALGLTHFSHRISYPLSQFGPVHGFFIYLQILVGLEPAQYAVPIVSTVALVIALPAIFLMRHAYCRVCPVGGMLSLFSSASAVSLEKDHRNAQSAVSATGHARSISRKSTTRISISM